MSRASCCRREPDLDAAHDSALLRARNRAAGHPAGHVPAGTQARRVRRRRVRRHGRPDHARRHPGRDRRGRGQRVRRRASSRSRRSARTAGWSTAAPASRTSTTSWTSTSRPKARTGSPAGSPPRPSASRARARSSRPRAAGPPCSASARTASRWCCSRSCRAEPDAGGGRNVMLPIQTPPHPALHGRPGLLRRHRDRRDLDPPHAPAAFRPAGHRPAPASCRASSKIRPPAGHHPGRHQHLRGRSSRSSPPAWPSA